MPQLTTEAQVFIVEKLIETKSLYLSQCPPPPPSCRGGGCVAEKCSMLAKRGICTFSIF